MQRLARKSLAGGLAVMAALVGSHAMAQDPAPAVLNLPQNKFPVGFEIATITPLTSLSADRVLFLGVDGTLVSGFGDGDSRTAHDIGIYLGSRSRVNGGIVGFWAGVDLMQGQYGHSFPRGIAGVEFLGQRFIARAGGFVPFKNTSSPWTRTESELVEDPWNPGFFYMVDEVFKLVERAPSGIDGEIGLRIPLQQHATGASPEFRIFAGGYYLFGLGSDDVAGARLRAELDVYPWRAGSSDLRVTVFGQVTHDDATDTQGRGGIRLSFPFGGRQDACCATVAGSLKDGVPDQVAPPVDHMLDPVWRNRDPATGVVVKESLRIDPFIAIASDRRLKRDVALVATTASGVKLYRFRYNADVDPSGTIYVGVMAQDIIATHPEAVVIGSNGFMAVRYDLLGLRMTTWERWQEAGMAAAILVQRRQSHAWFPMRAALLSVHAHQ